MATSFRTVVCPPGAVAAQGGDAAGRKLTATVAVSHDANAADASLSSQSFGYDASTGAPATTTVGSDTVRSGYDTWGRVDSYTDAAGNTTTTGYDIDGRTHTVDDGKDTTTYTYDGTDAAGNTEHRGLLTAETVSSGSAYPATFTGAYDAGGDLVQQDLPNGVTQTLGYDTTGAVASLVDVASGSSDPLINGLRHLHCVR